MADPSFTEMEAEAEGFVPRFRYQTTRADKLNTEPHSDNDQAETSPLLGPPILSHHTEKKWYNTASVTPSTKLRLI
jgi:hypothetical protein